MSRTSKPILVSADTGLLAHWQHALKIPLPRICSSFSNLDNNPIEENTVVWLDLALPDIPDWAQPSMKHLLQMRNVKVVATSSNPKDSEAMQALGGGCSGYCHAYADAATLLQVKQVVEAGNVWIGKSLMGRLIQTANNAASAIIAPKDDWGPNLSTREREIAILAANGASNLEIARECKISERTVKAHLSAVFEKLNLTDRLQLALRVHGIN
jgi:DNA-binding NarL/FixJ family response regulator